MVPSVLAGTGQPSRARPPRRGLRSEPLSTRASQFLNSQRPGDGDWDMISPPGLSIKEDKFRDAIAVLWEHAEPDAQRLLREAGIPFASGQDEESPAKQLSKSL